ncbi:MAG: hypothetical protein U0X91_07375 [Spirosomataceae bacterium]
MNLLTNDEQFEILDGVASAEVRQRHLHLMMTDENYRQSFQELRELHEGLAALPLESPSLAFEHKLMTRWETVQSAYKTPVFLRLLPFLFAAILVVLLVGSSVLWGLQTDGNAGTGSDFDNLLNRIDLNMIQSLLLPVNSLLLLLIIERIVKNRWKRLAESV